MFATFEAVDSAVFRDQLKKEFAPLEREVFKVRKPSINHLKPTSYVMHQAV